MAEDDMVTITIKRSLVDGARAGSGTSHHALVNAVIAATPPYVKPLGLAPGESVPWDDICNACHGHGETDGYECSTCSGTGRRSGRRNGWRR